jgi:SAM-dependent methyltransferase
VIAGLLGVGPADRVLDLACGHGRHARELAGRVGAIVGIDRSGEYLRRAQQPPHPDPLPRLVPGERETASYVQGDVRGLPFRDGAFDALFSWYASLFMFDDATNAGCLAEAARVVRPGGRLLVHHANPVALAADPVAAASRTLPDGSAVEERSVFDATRGVDVCARRIVRPGGTVLAGTAELRYYMPSEWGGVAARARLRLVELTSTPDAARGVRREPGADAPDLIALLEKPT